MEEIIEKFQNVMMQEMKELMVNEIGNIVKREVRIVIKEEVRDIVKEEVRTVVRDELRDIVKEEVRTVIKEELRDIVKEEVRTVIKEEVRDIIKEEINAELQEMNKNIEVLRDAVFIIENEHGRKIDAMYDLLMLEQEKNSEKSNKIHQIDQRVDRNEINILSHEKRLSVLEKVNS